MKFFLTNCHAPKGTTKDENGVRGSDHARVRPKHLTIKRQTKASNSWPDIR